MTRQGEDVHLDLISQIFFCKYATLSFHSSRSQKVIKFMQEDKVTKCMKQEENVTFYEFEGC